MLVVRRLEALNLGLGGMVFKKLPLKRVESLQKQEVRFLQL